MSQKDATIELLKEKNTFLSDQLKSAKELGPDKLAESLSSRVSILEGELERLNADKDINALEIKDKEKELSNTRKKAEKLKYQLTRATEFMEEFFCPDCGAAMTERSYQTQSMGSGSQEAHFDVEVTYFECGYTLVDGDTQAKCPLSESAET